MSSIFWLRNQNDRDPWMRYDVISLRSTLCIWFWFWFWFVLGFCSSGSPLFALILVMSIDVHAVSLLCKYKPGACAMIITDCPELPEL